MDWRFCVVPQMTYEPRRINESVRTTKNEQSNNECRENVTSSKRSNGRLKCFLEFLLSTDQGVHITGCFLVKSQFFGYMRKQKLLWIKFMNWSKEILRIDDLRPRWLGFIVPNYGVCHLKCTHKNLKRLDRLSIDFSAFTSHHMNFTMDVHVWSAIFEMPNEIRAETKPVKYWILTHNFKNLKTSKISVYLWLKQNTFEAHKHVILRSDNVSRNKYFFCRLDFREV